MKKFAPLVRILFLALFVFLLKSGFLLAWLAIYAVSLLFPLLKGRRFYCMLACPMNTLTLWLMALKKKLGLKNRPAPRWLEGGRLPWVSLLITVAVFIISRRLIGRDFPMMLVWIAVSLMMTFFFHPDVFHDRVCPFGAPQGCLAKRSLLDADARAKARDYQGFTRSVLGGKGEGKA